MAETGIAGYYDRLNRWNRIAQLLGYGGGRRTLTVHRALADPHANGRPTPSRLHDLIREVLPPLDALDLLDAGCGLGGTMLDLARHRRGRFIGVTLSPVQAATANEAARAAGVADRVEAMVQSYDAPPQGPFDVVLAIESMAHSPSPVRTLAALVAVLKPEGMLIVVDDMPEPGARAEDLETFKRGWQCPVLWTAAEWRAALTDGHLSLTVDRDLTPECRPRSLSGIARLESLNRLAALLPLDGLRRVLESHRGGLALERLLRQGGVAYRMLVARKRSESG
jgi:SAM-dependent methyltransferase